MKRNICGIMIDDLDRRRLCAEVTERLGRRVRTVIFTPNPIMVQNAKRDPEFLQVLSRSDYNIPDGNGLILASRLLKTPIPERIGGIDLAEDMLAYAAAHGLGVFFFGGKEGVAQKAADRLRLRYPTLKVCGTENGYINENENESLIKKINASRASLLYVCTGSPRQEKWINRNSPRLPHVLLFMGLGGSLDVWSGEVRRAPKSVQNAGGEWAWRMATAPKKLKDLPKLVSFGVSAVAKSISSIGTMHR